MKQFSNDLAEQVSRLTLKEKIEKQYREQIFAWADKNLTPESYVKLTKSDFSKMKGIDEMAEHIIKEHPDKLESSTKFELKNIRIVEN